MKGVEKRRARASCRAHPSRSPASSQVVVHLTDAYRLRLRKSKDRHTCIQVSHCMKHKMEVSGVGTQYPGGESPL